MTSIRLHLLIAVVLILGSACVSTHAQVPTAPKHIKPEDAAASAVQAIEKDYKIEPGVSSAKAGSIDFVVKNDGKEAHEFVVVPVYGDRYGEPVAEIEHFPPAESRAIRAELEPGKYVFVCLMVSVVDDEPQSHMALGMNAPFEVTE